MNSNSHNFRPPKKICFMHRASTGDSLLATPVYRAAKECFPDCQTVLVTSPVSAELLKGIPYIDKLVSYRNGDSVLPVIKSMWRADAAIILDYHYRNAFFAFLALIGKRIGRGKNFLTEIIKDDSADTFEPLKYLKIAQSLGIETDDLRLYRPTGTPDEKLRVQKIYREVKGDMSRLAVIVPYSLSGVKDWSAQKYREIIKRLAAKGCATAIVGGAENRERAAKDFPMSVNLAGRTNLRESAEFVAMCDLQICGCTSMLHIATAVGTPAVAIYGPTAPQQWAPKENCVVITKNFPCSPCYNTANECKQGGESRCLKAISIEDVWAATENVLRSLPS